MCKKWKEPLRDFIIFYDTSNENMINRIILTEIHQLRNFQVEFKNEDILELFILRLDEIIYILENDIVNISSEVLINMKNKIKNHNKKSEDNTDENIKKYDLDHIYDVYFIKLKRKYISDFLIYNCDEYKKDYEDITQLLDEFVSDYTYKQNAFNEEGFYKNIIHPENWNTFENMTDLIKGELIRFEMNIIYCRKIKKFIDEEFSKEGVSPTDIMFINNFMDNALSEMTLVATKLYSKARFSGGNQNFGFEYLQSTIYKYASNKELLATKVMNKEFKDLVKSAKEIVKKIEVLRNAYIVHYDLEKLEAARSVELNLSDFEEIYDISCKVFEKLSLYRFHYYDSAYMNLIKYRGFKSTVCKNYYVNNSETIDLDGFLDLLRLNLKSRLIEGNRSVNNIPNKENN